MSKKTPVVAVVQARMSSTRFPGKTMEPVLGKPMLARMMERLGRATRVDKIVVATSEDPSDDPVAGLCGQIGIDCFRGDLSDVLGRYYHAAAAYDPDYVVRVTGDCPLIDPEIVDTVVRTCLEGGYDYAANSLQRTMPHGVDAEAFRFSCLEEAALEATLAIEREHVTPFIRSRPDRYRLFGVEGAKDLSEYRLTVDWPEDLELVRAVYAALYPGNPEFTTGDIVALLDAQPDMRAINAHRSDPHAPPPPPRET